MFYEVIPMTKEEAEKQEKRIRKQDEEFYRAIIQIETGAGENGDKEMLQKAEEALNAIQSLPQTESL